MSYFDKLPIEIRDRIFLSLPYNDLKNTREYQSIYVKEVTEYGDIDEAEKNGNLKNMKWLIENGYKRKIYITRYITIGGCSCGYGCHYLYQRERLEVISGPNHVSTNTIKQQKSKSKHLVKHYQRNTPKHQYKSMPNKYF